jgi:hypothetical protein
MPQGTRAGWWLLSVLALSGCGTGASPTPFSPRTTDGGSGGGSDGTVTEGGGGGFSDSTVSADAPGFAADGAATDAAASDAPPDTAATGADSGSSSAGPEGGTDAKTDSPTGPPGLGCSADLQSVVDANGNVVMMCPPALGCASGQCVPACTAASAAHGTIGCNFIQATPSFYPGITPPCWAVFLANSWGAAATVQVTYNGASYDVTKFGRLPVAGQPESSWPLVPATGIPVGQVAVLFISSDPNSSNLTPLTCPVTDALNMGTVFYTGSTASTGIGQSWQIVTSVPVTGYDILPYGGALSYLPSAELLIPSTAWGTNYTTVVPKLGQALNSAPPGPQWAQIVAMSNNTMVQVQSVVSLPSGTGVAAAPANVTTTYTLSAGQVLQWQDSGEMSGSIISSNNPVGFNGGNGYICYSSQTSVGGGCDSAHQQIPPVSAAGSTYVAPPYTTRRADLQAESIPYRIVGMVAGTTLTYDPPVAAAPATLTLGQVVDFESTVAFTVSSQDASHPFYVGQIMPGCMVTSGSRPGINPNNTTFFGTNCLGDEEFVNILPPAQFLSKYIFFTDPTYATTNLVFVRVKGATGFHDVTLDCAGTLTGWQPVGAGGQYEITNVDLVRGTAPNGTCNNGPHTAQSTGPFGLMVWGLDSYSSYAYPAGGNVTPINTVVIPVGH